jgi:sec-independent protein translocase protein TatB
MLSIPHMIVVFVVVLVVFGPQKLPELARGLGKLMAEFRKASLDFKTAFEEEMRDLERQALLAERKKAAEAVAAGAPTEPAQSAAVSPSSAVDTGAGQASEEAGAAAAEPVVAPSAESVARNGEDHAGARSEGPAPATMEDSPQDSTERAQRPA